MLDHVSSGVDVVFKHWNGKLYKKCRDCLLPAAIIDELLSRTHSRELYVDACSGPGILVRQLKPYFKRSFCIDSSESMVAESECEDVMLGSANNIPTGDDSVDLLTVMNAFRWLDYIQFMTEADRILTPNDVLVIIDSKHTNHWKLR
jgi:ubiquinone/menaquinone biosynthesis C-methylase UbiE